MTQPAKPLPLRAYGPTFGEALFLILGNAFGYLVAVLLQGVNIPENLPTLVGALVGGGAGLMTASLAWRGFHRWEERHVRERNARVAGEAIVAVADACSAIQEGAGLLALLPVTKQPITDIALFVELVRLWHAL